MQPTAELEVSVDRLDEDGRGVGAADGLEVHVAGALPGERVRAAVEHRSPHAARAWAKLLTIVGAPSPSRVQPACPAHGTCGGCALQHLAADAQLGEKHARVVAALAPLALPVGVEPVVPSPLALGYRNRAKYVIAAGRAGLYRASYAPASHAPVAMAGCRVPEPPIDDVAGAIVAALARAGLSAYDERSHSGELRHLVIRRSAAGQLLALVVTRTDGAAAELAAAARAVRAAQPALVGVVRQIQPQRGGAILGEGEHVLDGAATLVDELGPVRLRLSAGAFFQVNRAQAARLYAHVADELAAGPGTRAVDLYGGVGGIALTLAARGARTVGVESHAPATGDAIASAALSGLADRAAFLTADAADGLPRAAAQLGAVDALVVNPPKKGLSAAARAAVAALAPPRLVYVSCGPDSLARDLAELTRTTRLRPTRVLPFDLMPGTPQVETVVTLAS